MSLLLAIACCLVIEELLEGFEALLHWSRFSMNAPPSNLSYMIVGSTPLLPATVITPPFGAADNLGLRDRGVEVGEEVNEVGEDEALGTKNRE